MGFLGGTAKIWEAVTGQELLTLAGHTGSVVRHAFSPDGTRLATVSADRTARIWIALTGHELVTRYGENSAMEDIAFSPDGTRLFIITDEAARVCGLRIDDLLALAKSRVTRSLATAECQQYLQVKACPAGP